MKKYMFLAAAAMVALASCNNESPKMDEKPAAKRRKGFLSSGSTVRTL